MAFLSTVIYMDRFYFVMTFGGRWKQHNCAASVPFPTRKSFAANALLNCRHEWSFCYCDFVLLAVLLDTSIHHYGTIILLILPK